MGPSLERADVIPGCHGALALMWLWLALADGVALFYWQQAEVRRW